MAGVPVLEVASVRKAYHGHVAVDELSLTIGEGRIFGLLGPNGAGKTTAIRMMVGIIIPDAGAVRMFGEPLARRHLRRVGFLPEERGLYRKVRVRDHLMFLGGLYGLDRARARAAAEEWMARLDLAAWIDRKVEELSKGMQQKVQFIAALMHEPRFIVMDEPFSGLDPLNSSALIEVLLELKRAGRTIIFSTHRMDQVERLCDSICLMDRGRAALTGELKEIRSRYGKRNVTIAFRGDGRFLENREMVAAHNDFGSHVEVRLANGADPQALLRTAAENAAVTRFELIEPSLEEIFIEVTGNHDGR
jgi:ABC-2 type transport system ATP-binding protein